MQDGVCMLCLLPLSPGSASVQLALHCPDMTISARIREKKGTAAVNGPQDG